MKFTFTSSAALIVFAGLQFATALPAAAPEPQTDAGTPQILARQAGTCGPSNGLRCTTPGYLCCSQWGWCGSTAEHCGSGCQSGYGNCNGVTPPPTTPPPTNPPTGSRPRLGNVPYGVTLYSCTAGNTVALTFDDGPYIYTQQLINLLNSRGAKATFFVNGANWGDPITTAGQAQIVRNAYNSGHQIGSHTWSHPDLSTLDAAGIRSQMNQLESALLNIIGRYPTYMRPPYLSCGNTCLSTLNTLGYHVISTNLDTNDWRQDPAASRRAIDGFFSGSLVLAHDVHSMTVNNLAAYMIDTAQRRGLRLVTVGECFGDPVANWYRTTL